MYARDALTHPPAALTEPPLFRPSATYWIAEFAARCFSDVTQVLGDPVAAWEELLQQDHTRFVRAYATYLACR